MGAAEVIKLTPLAEAIAAGHAKYGPSSATELMLCNGRNAMESMFPNPPSKPAADGTCSHEMAAHCFREKVRAETLIGKVYSIDGWLFSVDQEREIKCPEHPCRQRACRRRSWAARYPWALQFWPSPPIWASGTVFWRTLWAPL